MPYGKFLVTRCTVQCYDLKRAQVCENTMVRHFLADPGSSRTY